MSDEFVSRWEVFLEQSSRLNSYLRATKAAALPYVSSILDAISHGHVER